MLKHTIVYAEDDLDDLFIMTQAFQKHDHIEVLHAPDGKKAMLMLESMAGENSLPCLVILDINMPVMNGWEFMDEFVKIRPGLSKKIDIYILSSSTDSHDIQKAKSNPAITGYIVKPLTPQLLQRMFFTEKEREEIR